LVFFLGGSAAGDVEVVEVVDVEVDLEDKVDEVDVEAVEVVEEAVLEETDVKDVGTEAEEVAVEAAGLARFAETGGLLSTINQS
jgi:hypothetical protein